VRRTASLLGALLAVGLLSPAAGGAVTVGAPLGLSANVSDSCQGLVIVGVAPSCTMFGSDAGGAWTSQTPRGSWRITRARVRTGPSVGPMAFTVLRALRSQAGSPPAGVICCTVPAESQVFTPAPNTVNELTVNLPAFNTVENIDGEPVEIVDYLGISMLNLNSSLPVHRATSAADPAASASFTAFIPAIRAGQQALQFGGFFESAVLVNGEFEPANSGEPATVPPEPVAPVLPPPPPANSFAFLPRVRQLPGGRARLGMNLPGPGLLSALLARGAGAASLSARGSKSPSRRAGKGKRGNGKGKRRPPRLLRPARRRVAQAGKAYVVLRLTKVGKRRLARRGRLRLPVRVVFTPDGGTPAGRVRQVVFRKPQAQRKKCKGKAKRCATRRKKG
jgi:hypothetical protein